MIEKYAVEVDSIMLVRIRYKSTLDPSKYISNIEISV